MPLREIGPTEISEFIKAHHPSEAWRSDTTEKWVEWMLMHDCIDAFTEDGNKISVVISARKTTKEKANDDFDINPQGECIAIDLIVADRKYRPFLLGSMARFLMSKHGMPENVYWRRITSAPKTVSAQHLATRLNLLP